MGAVAPTLLIKKVPPRPQFLLTMEWIELKGFLFVNYSDYAGQILPVKVNDVEYPLEFNDDGLATIQFEPSTPQLSYTVMMRDEILDGEEPRDQKMTVFY